MRLKFFVALPALLFTITNVFCQEKFGRISKEDFDLTKNQFDTSVSAVVIADIGISSFEGNSKDWFNLVHKRRKRIKILNRNGFDAANVEVLLYAKGGEEERMDNLRASTYNLEEGQIVETRLDNSNVFKEKISKNYVRKKFTFPALKEGSIIEYSYTLSSDFLFNLQPWAFQGKYPCLWSEYQVDMPEFFNYVIISQGYNPFYLNKSVTSTANFRLQVRNGTNANKNYIITAQISKKRWVMKDVPPLKVETFTSSISNHISKIEFQLSQYLFPNSLPQNILGNWVTANEELMQNEQFGKEIVRDNNWLNDDIKNISLNSINPLDRAKKIFFFIRDHFTCTDHSDIFLNNSLKTIFKNKNGSVADLNLLLIAMLRHENIKAVPLLLSTRDHGFATDVYPLISRFNYVIAVATIDGKNYNLDASRPLGFGKLAADCYNGVARVISDQPSAIYLEADSVREQKFTTIIIVNNDKGKLNGSYQSVLGYIESFELRSRVKTSGESAYFEKLRSASGTEMDVEEEGIDSLEKFEDPLRVRYNFSMKAPDEDIVYFNPMMGEGYEENLFKAAVRKYPVEMPYALDESFVLNMETPGNFIIEELPKSARVDLNGGEGWFEYLIGKTAKGFLLRSRIVLKKANFLPEDYNSLRDFFGYIVKKHSEQIVFKKKP